MSGTQSPTHPSVPIDRLRRPVERIVHLENISGIALIAAAVVAVVLANSPLSEAFDHLLHTRIELKGGPISIDESLVHWVNDALMTIFFLVAGLEIKRELVTGDLRDPRKAALPAFAALGGMLVPALLFYLTSGPEGRAGWGIPMATDIAFAIGVLTLLGKRVPSKLKVFLLTLAIIDDLGAILVIAIVYTSSLNLNALAVAGVGVVVIIALQWAGVRWIPAYAMVGAVVWLATFESGVHATLAGVVCGLLTPARPHRPHRTEVAASSETTFGELKAILFDAKESLSVADRLINHLHPWVALFIVPVFALSNAGVVMTGGALGEAIASSTARAIVIGLVIGKPIGITLAALLAVKIGLAALPTGVNWQQVAGVGMLAGIGFTVSLFITDLAYDSDVLVANSKIGVLTASVLASVVGAVLLHRASRPVPAELGPMTFEELDRTVPASVLAVGATPVTNAQVVSSPTRSTD
ncbi:MAG: Na+/H+ antiporter NhaA [Acidimicrobiales bacterium]